MSSAPTPITPLLQDLRRRSWRRLILRALAWGLLAAGLLRLFGVEVAPWVGVLLATLVIGVGRNRGSAWKVDERGLARHLDRRFPSLEESATLLTADSTALRTTEQMQRKRVEAAWPHIQEERERWLPRNGMGPYLLVAALGGLLVVLGPALRTPMERALTPATERSGTDRATFELQLIGVEVQPPAYTGLASFSVQEYDLEVPEGSQVRWRFRAIDGEGLHLRLSDGSGSDRFVTLDAAGENEWLGTANIDRTGLYRVERRRDRETHSLPGVHTLAVTLDRPPRLRLLEPTETAVEIPLEGPAALNYRVRVEDDHGVGDVEIRASVAKGSGEGVKFRDELFAFENRLPVDGGVELDRAWSLSALGMEPGDEIYFFAVATDNRPGTPNQARSDTVVVRWLDEDVPAELTDGLAIDVLPEYFKSQRQIIIETEQLIADRDELEPTVFELTSRDLGQHQADLKNRYGQYLGDEFDEGGSPFTPAMDTDGGSDGDGDGDGDHEDHDAPDLAGGGHEGHDHDEPPAGPDTSGTAADLTARFMHDHGTADIGPITRRNPVGLMKRSISNMWQAELHLRLGEPDKALPFEYEALKYLNLARQADRIYTRRLGFEPPPVTEERRLTGELDEIASRIRRLEGAPDSDTTGLIRDLHSFLTAARPGQPLDEDELSLLRAASSNFTDRSQDRPALLRHAATLEQYIASERLEAENCDGCLEGLRSVAWSLLPPVSPDPGASRRAAPDATGLDYLERLERIERNLEQGSVP